MSINKKIFDLNAFSGTLAGSYLFETSNNGGGSYKLTLDQLSAFIGATETYSGLTTTAKTLVGAINEVKTAASYWTRNAGTSTLSPTTANDNLNIGSGSITSGAITASGNVIAYSASSLLKLGVNVSNPLAPFHLSNKGLQPISMYYTGYAPGIGFSDTDTYTVTRAAIGIAGSAADYITASSTFDMCFCAYTIGATIRFACGGSTQTFGIANNSLVFADAAGTHASFIQNGTLTSNITLTLPITAGTIALTSQIPAQYWDRTGIVIYPHNTGDTLNLGSGLLYSGTYYLNGDLHFGQSSTQTMYVGTASIQSNIIINHPNAYLQAYNVVIGNYASGYYGTISVPTLATSNRGWSLPDASGIIALTTDIPAATFTHSGSDTYMINTTDALGIGGTVSTYTNYVNLKAVFQANSGVGSRILLVGATGQEDFIFFDDGSAPGIQNGYVGYKPSTGVGRWGSNGIDTLIWNQNYITLIPTTTNFGISPSLNTQAATTYSFTAASKNYLTLSGNLTYTNNHVTMAAGSNTGAIYYNTCVGGNFTIRGGNARDSNNNGTAAATYTGGNVVIESGYGSYGGGLSTTPTAVSGDIIFNSYLSGWYGFNTLVELMRLKLINPTSSANRYAALGINTNAPVESLHVHNVTAYGGIAISGTGAALRYSDTSAFTIDRGDLGLATTANMWFSDSAQYDMCLRAASGQRLRLGAGSGGTTLSLDSSGNASIWNYLYIGGNSPAATGAGYFFSSTVGTLTSISSTIPVSLETSGTILSHNALVAASDSRIKTNVTPIDPDFALSQINQLVASTYTYIDTVQKGTRTKIGFIAQAVESVIGEAISQTNFVIPNVYTVSSEISFDAETKILNVKLSKAHQFSAGDKVRLITALYQNEYIVSTIISDTEFQIDNWNPVDFGDNPNSIFVYGKWVNDYRVVDDAQIGAVNVAATQALNSKITVLTQRIQGLEASVGIH